MVLDTWPNTNEIIKANNHAGRNTASSHSAALSDNLEAALAAARPRLLRFARKRGIAPDAADDVVQETLIEAWRHLNHLRTPDRFEAWLTGICRNVCLRWSSAHRNPSSSLEQFPSIPGREMYGRPFVGTLPPTLAEDIADPQALDPAEELSRQDLATLLDRALGYLSPGTREVLELHYLSEFSQHETALRLGLTINALEVRLHRARRQLRQVLNNELRADAHTFGLPLDDDQDAVTGWRETRLWCMFCGRHRLQGLFESLPDGRINLRLRCPDCLQYGRREWIVSGGMFELAGLKSFRPAFNRMQTSALHYWTPAHERQRCPWCGAPVQVRLLRPGERFLHAQPWAGLKWTKYCSSCDSDASNYIGAMIWLHPLAQQFMAQHPRWLNEPEQLVEYAGQPAFRVHLTDSTSAASLTFLLHSETLHVHTVLQEH